MMIYIQLQVSFKINLYSHIMKENDDLYPTSSIIQNKFVCTFKQAEPTKLRGHFSYNLYKTYAFFQSILQLCHYQYVFSPPFLSDAALISSRMQTSHYQPTQKNHNNRLST
jgi:hypothetical protein